MNFTLLKNVFFVVLYFLLFQVIVAQEKARINKIDHKLWSQIQAQLNEDTNIKSFNFIKQLTTNYKTVKPDSLFSVYYQIMIKLESEFNIPAAIYVGEEMVSIAKKQNNLEQEANTYLNLFRYYDAMGLYNLSLNSVNKAHDIFTRLSQENNIIFSKLMLLSERSYFEDPKLILNEIKKLQKEAYKLNDERINKEILIELIGIALLAKDFTVAANNINKLESTLGAKPENNKDFTLWMLIATTRAEIALAENNISKAKKHYNEVLQLSTQKPDKWREIESLKKLAEIALLEGNIKNANTYLNKALPKAKQLNIPELLTEIYSLKAAIAEKHLKYKEANLYLKQREHYSNVFSDRSKGFNYEAYYIHKEKEKLATEKKNSELELSLQKTQIKNSFYLMALIFSIALGAIVAYFLERKRKQIAITKSNLTKFHLSQLENLDKTKSRFFANISHELRTPLSLIVAPISTMLNEKNISEKQRKIIQTVDKNAKHLVAITNNILSLKKLESGNLVLALQPTNLFTFFQIQIKRRSSDSHQQVRC
ncbi:MAG: tetratricopeptide repeat-containing sensor histidine kinase, partial [Oceanihabitans sp.]